ncbi:tRNA (guanine(37)-N1)-methyltransferase 1 [Nesidiocoris tenuis]|uniref:tRNA (guanine(37)-N1)-methyltransferase n=1 Tax=Nesidiocoris tenuis TaxID=355587 RepID=A0ABN7BF08_9HEMI|nr:tRNA (guanine(37)-N1)-methyltransferase 1 [Nesidiocoris tenuis]
MKPDVLSVPDRVRGMKVMDKSTFRKIVHVHCYSFETSKAQLVQKLLKPYLLKIPKFSPIVSGSGSSCRVAHLDPNKIPSGFSDFEPVVQQKLADAGTSAETIVRQLELTYDNYTHDEILRAIIPEELDGVTSFSIIGHIVHLNLRPELNEYKTVIGQVLLDKIPHARTVVTKTDNIDSKFRNFKMEIIAGEEDFIATTKENRAIFKLDFSKVYWNPRLCTEHERFVSRLNKGDVLFDVFCGIGPFVIPAAKKGVKCFANDLNPDSVHWLRENLKTNKINLDSVSVSTLDGVDFVTDVFKSSLLALPAGDYQIAIAMNLPSLAFQFLPAFKGLLSEEDVEALTCRPIPVVYCYMFLKGVPESERSAAARKIVENELGNLGNEEFLRVDFVRNVAPNKDMIVVSIRLTENILVNHKRARLSMPPLEVKNS